MSFWKKFFALGQETTEPINMGIRNPDYFEEVEFDWTPVLKKAEVEIINKANLHLLLHETALEKEKAEFSIEITSFRNNTLKIIYKNQIDVIPIDDIRRVNLQRGSKPSIEKAYYRIQKDGFFTLDTGYPHGFWFHEDEKYSLFDHAIPAENDVVIISPILKLEVPFGLGESVLNKIQELLAQ